jgi:predicted AlkP superfamily phosphohydrolase/phosphomutase
MSAPVVMVGLDAADSVLVDRLVAEGAMPNLASLRAGGCFGRLEPRPPAFLSMVWPSLINGVPVTQHGWYFNKVWSPDRMRLEHVGRGWLPQQPFWEPLVRAGGRAAILDVPFAPAPDPGFPGLFVTGWQCHDDAAHSAQPEGLWRELVGRFGKPALTPEMFGPQTASSLQKLTQELLAATRQMGDIAASLLARERFDLFVTVLGGTHRGGHYLWDLSQVDGRSLDSTAYAALESALRQIYVEADEALGRILAAAPAGARVVTFALHGMAPNDGWADRFPALVDLVRGGGGKAKGGLVYRLKRAIPWSLAREITSRLPQAVTHRLVPLWSARMHDWSKTRWFGLPVDVNGYLRINLRGRDAGGIVEPGADYDRVCEELTSAFLSLETIDDGQKVVAAVDRTDELAPGSPALRYLPDLVARWGSFRAPETSGVRLPGRGEIHWERGAPLASGRSGNHVGRGWFAAAGPGLASGQVPGSYDVCDLPATMLHWLGLGGSLGLSGTPIPALSPAARAMTPA